MVKSTVLFATGVKTEEKLYVLRECLDVIKTYFYDCKIFIAINLDAHESTESIIQEYTLNCEVKRLSDERLHFNGDPASFQLALNMLFESHERFDLLWFMHTKGGHNSRDVERRLYHEKFYPSRKYIEEKFAQLPKLGVYGYRGTKYDWNAHEKFFAIRGEVYDEPFVKDLWKNGPTEIFKYNFCEMLIVETMFAMRAEIMYKFLQTYPEFFQTKIGEFIDARYFIEGEICNFIPTRMGYYPFVMENNLLFNHGSALRLVDNWIEKNNLEEFKTYKDILR